MTLTRAWAVDQAYPNAADQRKQLAAIYPREGVFPDPTTTAAAGIAYAGTGWGVSARAFTAAIKRGGAPYSTSYGTALVGNDAPVVNAWTIGAAPGAGTRIDLLCIRAKDASAGDSLAGAPTDGPGGVARAIPEFVVVAGTAGTPGVRPAIPAGYEEIAEVTTPSGAVSSAGSTIKQTYAFAHVNGGPIYVRTAAERDALTNVLDGDAVVLIGGTNLRGIRRNGAWDMDTDWTNFTYVNGWSNLGGGFAPGRFRKLGGIVHVQGTIRNGTPGSAVISPPIPPGSRPTSTLIFITPANAGVADVRVFADGGIVVNSYYAGGSNAIVGLNLSFPAEQ